MTKARHDCQGCNPCRCKDPDPAEALAERVLVMAEEVLTEAVGPELDLEARRRARQAAGRSLLFGPEDRAGLDDLVFRVRQRRERAVGKFRETRERGIR